MTMQDILAARLNQELYVPKKSGQINSASGSILLEGYNANEGNM